MPYAIPVGIPVTRLTGRFLHPDGSPGVGGVTFRGPRSVTFAGADTIMVGLIEVALDSNGEFSVVLMSTDTVEMSPTGWTYSVTERIVDCEGRSYPIFLRADPPEVDLAELAPASPMVGVYLPVVGPQGPPTTVNGKSGVSITLTAADVEASPLPQQWSQVIASSVWTIPHTLPYRPEVSTYDLDGREIGGTVLYPDVSTAVVSFTYAETGSALLR